MTENENIVVNNTNENEENISQPIDTIILDKVYVEYPDGSVKLKNIGILPWDIK